MIHPSRFTFDDRPPGWIAPVAFLFLFSILTLIPAAGLARADGTVAEERVSPAKFRGQFPVKTIQMGATRGRGRIVDLCEDRNGLIYACNSRGVLTRHTGERWERLQGTGIRMVKCDKKGHLICASRTELFKYSCDGPRDQTPVPLTEALEQKGVHRSEITSLAEVDRSVFVTTANSMARITMNGDSTEFEVWEPDQFPEGLSIVGVLRTGGTTLIHFQVGDDIDTFRLGKIAADRSIEMLDVGQDIGRVDQILPPFSSDNLCLLLTRFKLLEISRSVEEVKATIVGREILPQLRFWAGRWANDELLAIFTQHNGILFFDRDRNIRFHQSLSSIPGQFGDFMLADKKGTLWLPRDGRIHLIDVSTNTLTWKQSDATFVRATIATPEAAFLGGKYVFRAAVDPASGIPTEEFRVLHKVTGSSFIELGDKLLVSTGRGAKLFGTGADSELTTAGPDQNCLQVVSLNKADEFVAFYGRRNSPTVRHLRRVEGAWKVIHETEVESFLYHAIFDPNTDSVWWPGSNEKGQTHRIDLKSFSHFTFPEHGAPFLNDGQLCIALLKRIPTIEKGLFRSYDHSTETFVDHDHLNKLCRSSHWNWRLGEVQAVLATEDDEFLITTNKAPLLRCSTSSGLPKLSLLFDTDLIDGNVLATNTTANGGLWISSGHRVLYRSSPSTEFHRHHEDLNPRVMISELTLTRGTTESVLKAQAGGANFDQRLFAMPYDVGTLRCGFSVPAFGTNEDVLYQTKLVGLDDAWSPATRESEWESVALHEGDYKLQVRALLPNGHTTKPSAVVLTISPPWHRSWRLYVPVSLAILASFFGLYWWRTRLQRAHLHALTAEIEERRQTELQLRDAQTALVKRARLRALGEIAAGVAHDVNNALSPVLILSELMSTDPTLPPKTVDHCKTVANCAADASKIIRRMNPLYRNSSSSREYADVRIGSVLSEVVQISKMYADQHHPGKVIRFNIGDGDVVLCCDASEIRELLVNLANNAVDAIQGIGTVTLDCETDGNVARLKVTDDGCGMSEEVRGRCLESFFTTKGEFGSGLGLSLARTIVDTCGGRIEVGSVLDEGTTITVALPLVQPSVINQPADLESRALRVLVVDDIATTRHAISLLVRSLDHEVHEAESGEQALDVLRQATGPGSQFDVLLTDYAMPGISGAELCREVRRESPSMYLILTSGNETPGMPEFCDDFLPKPVSIGRMRQALSTVVNSPG